jgi:hypothetical protein
MYDVYMVGGHLWLPVLQLWKRSKEHLLHSRRPGMADCRVRTKYWTVVGATKNLGSLNITLGKAGLATWPRGDVNFPPSKLSGSGPSTRPVGPSFYNGFAGQWPPFCGKGVLD